MKKEDLDKRINELETALDGLYMAKDEMEMSEFRDKFKSLFKERSFKKLFFIFSDYVDKKFFDCFDRFSFVQFFIGVLFLLFTVVLIFHEKIGFFSYTFQSSEVSFLFFIFWIIFAMNLRTILMFFLFIVVFLEVFFFILRFL